MNDAQAQQPPPAAGGENDLYSYRRGDIPIFNFDEADRILIATLQELIEVRLWCGRGFNTGRGVLGVVGGFRLLWPRF